VRFLTDTCTGEGEGEDSRNQRLLVLHPDRAWLARLRGPRRRIPRRRAEYAHEIQCGASPWLIGCYFYAECATLGVSEGALPGVETALPRRRGKTPPA